MLQTIKYINLALAFFLELAMLAAIGYWGFQLKQSMAVKIAAGIGLPAAVAIIWGVVLSPKATLPFAEPFRGLTKLALFAASAYLLYAAGQERWAVILVIALAINLLLLYMLGQ